MAFNREDDPYGDLSVCNCLHELLQPNVISNYCTVVSICSGAEKAVMLTTIEGFAQKSETILLEVCASSEG